MSNIRNLIDYFIPENYRLHLDISKSQRRFNGTVTVTGKPVANEMRLHSRKLEIIKVSTGDQKLNWRLEDDELIIDGKHSNITVEFAGKISETAMNGLYLCRYEQFGQKKELFATQFESHYARECFPCVDEPAAKATFDISIKSDDPSDTIVLSNMPGKKLGDRWVFDTTPRMSTYLVAFVGGELNKKSTITKNGVEVSVYASPAQPVSSLDYALNVAKKSVEYYEEYFGVKYPLPKLDNVALPDFSAGAMENWGLITYREAAMLAGDSSAENSREYVATVIAHEISHQWFGNLVTMKWWNDLWLNESFASLMENDCVDNIYPEYNIWEDFETSDVISALKRDCITGVQSVQQEVSTPDEIATLFDGAIVYAKGQRLMRMLRAVIGNDAFRSGLTNYFNNYQFSNTTADNLWHELSSASNADVKALMDPWLTRPNYPLLSVGLNGGQLTVEQSEFHSDGSSDPAKIWPTPLFSNVVELPELLTEKSITVQLDNPEQVVQLNINNLGHYVVKYDNKLLCRLANNFSELSVVDKISLLYSSLLLSQAGQQDINHTIALLRSCRNEQNQAVLSIASNLVGALVSLTEPDSDEQKLIEKLAGEIFDKPFNRLFTDNSELSINDRKSLSVVLHQSVFSKNQQAIDYCQQQYQSCHGDFNSIAGDVRPTILSSIIVNGDINTFNSIWHTCVATQNADLRLDCINALTSARQPEIINAILSRLTDTSMVRPQETMYFVAWLLSNRYARKQTWQWLRDNWSWILDVFGGDMSYVDYVQFAGNSLRTESELVEFNQFFTKAIETSPALKRSVDMGSNSISNRIKWINRNRPLLNELLG